MYCMERLSFTAISESLGVADSTLRLWAKKYNWKEEREAIAQAESEIRVNTVKARAMVLGKLLESDDPKNASQMAYAVAALERLAFDVAKETAKQASAAAQVVAAPVTQDEKNAAEETFTLPDGIGDDERLALLEAGLNRKNAYLLNRPVPDLSRHIKHSKDSLDVMTEIRGRSADSGIQMGFLEDDE